jgi:hypothetical protein
MDASQLSQSKNASVIETTNPVTRTLPRFERREKDAVRDDAASPIDAQRLIRTGTKKISPIPGRRITLESCRRADCLAAPG